jgi:hypothetical protein
MALRNRSLQEENKLRGTDRSKDSTKFKLGQFRTLENWIPAHVYSIKKKRGVELLDSTPNTPNIPLPCGTGCTDSTERGQAVISIEDRFVQTGTFTCTFGGLRTSWGYITPEEEVWTLIGCSGCGGGNMNYNDTCTQVNRFQTPSILTHPALLEPDDQPTGMCIGTSDEPIYVRAINDLKHGYFPNTNTHVVYTRPVGLTWVSDENLFAKKDTSIYFPAHDTVFPNFFAHIVEYSAASGAVLNDFDFGEQFTIQQIALTNGFIYVLGSVVGSSDFPEIRKLDRTDGSLVATFFIDNLQPNNIGVVNDNLIYILGAGDRATMYYIKNFTDLVYVGYTGAQGFSPFGGATGLFVNGSFYYGSNGFSGFSTDIFKITISCPETPLIPSLNRDAASVAAGNTITVSWADILVPSVNDTILLYPEPAAGKLGFDIGGQLASQVTDGSGTGSLVFTIPGGTPPGTYVFMYSGPGFDIYIATSPTFTVT